MVAHARVPGTGLLESLRGFCHVGGCLLTPFLNARRGRWGATPEELAEPLPGDELIESPKGGSLRAVTLDAPVERVWPWVQQIGQQRGGFYSYQGLENLAGCQIRNVDRVLPELPPLDTGDPVYLSAKMTPYRVAICEAPRTLVLFQLIDPKSQRALTIDEPRPPSWFSSIWSFHLRPAEVDRTRLMVRGMADHSGGLGNRMTMAFVGPISYVMERALFRNLGELLDRPR